VIADLSDNEIIGRRLFGPESWRVEGAAFSVDLTHFYDKRLELDLSVDRLGVGNAENKRLQELTLLADAEAAERRPATTFDGWAAIVLRDLAFAGWNRAVRQVNNHKGKNKYHAEISRDNFRQKAQAICIRNCDGRSIFAQRSVCAATPHAKNPCSRFLTRGRSSNRRVLAPRPQFYFPASATSTGFSRHSAGNAAFRFATFGASLNMM